MDTNERLIDLRYNQAISLFEEIQHYIRSEFNSTSSNTFVSACANSIVKREDWVQFLKQTVFYNYRLNRNSKFDFTPEYYFNLPFPNSEGKSTRYADFLLKEDDEDLLILEIKYINHLWDIKSQITELNNQLDDTKTQDSIGMWIIFYTWCIEIDKINIEKWKKEIEIELGIFRQKVVTNLKEWYHLCWDYFDLKYNYDGTLSYVFIDYVFDPLFYYKITDNEYIDLGWPEFMIQLFWDDLDKSWMVYLNWNYYTEINNFENFLDLNAQNIVDSNFDLDFISLKRTQQDIERLNNIICKYYR